MICGGGGVGIAPVVEGPAPLFSVEGGPVFVPSTVWKVCIRSNKIFTSLSALGGGCSCLKFPAARRPLFFNLGVLKITADIGSGSCSRSLMSRSRDFLECPACTSTLVRVGGGGGPVAEVPSEFGQLPKHFS